MSYVVENMGSARFISSGNIFFSKVSSNVIFSSFYWKNFVSSLY